MQIVNKVALVWFQNSVCLLIPVGGGNCPIHTDISVFIIACGPYSLTPLFPEALCQQSIHMSAHCVWRDSRHEQTIGAACLCLHDHQAICLVQTCREKPACMLPHHDQQPHTVGTYLRSAKEQQVRVRRRGASCVHPSVSLWRKSSCFCPLSPSVLLKWCWALSRTVLQGALWNYMTSPDYLPTWIALTSKSSNLNLSISCTSRTWKVSWYHSLFAVSLSYIIYN